MYGKHLSEKHKQLLKTKYSKAVLQFSKEGVFLAEVPLCNRGGKNPKQNWRAYKLLLYRSKKNCIWFLWKYE